MIRLIYIIIYAINMIILFMSNSYAQPLVHVLEVKGAIGPATREFVVRSLEEAHRQRATLIILQLDTPGGLDSAMRDIIQAILRSSVPVATFVAPNGAHAASAGTYILYASHIAAMAPATNLGAATPVQIGGLPLPGSPTGDEKPTDKSESEQVENKDSSNKNAESSSNPLSTMERKMVNDARAYIRALAQLRNRNVEWADRAVTQAASLSATEALEQGVIDLVAQDVHDLIMKLHQREVSIADQRYELDVQNARIETITPDWRNQLLALITHPQVAYILMLVGVYGLFFELSNPGAIVPGVLGGISLILALFAFQVLPVNYAGLALILLGMLFMFAEALLPSFGILGFGGIIAFMVGSLILWDETGPGMGIPMGMISGFTIASALITVALGMMLIQQRRRPVVTGDILWVGASGEVVEDFKEEGWVRVKGTLWKARCNHPLNKGDHVQVIQREGLHLIVQ